MLKKLAEKLNQNKIKKENLKLEKQRNLPKFQLNELYVCEIVLYQQCVPEGHGIVSHYYKEVKKFAIFTKVGYDKYLHMKSKQTLTEMGGTNSVIGDYAVRNIRKIHKACPIYLRTCNLTPTSKVSTAFIETLEDDMNQLLRPDQEVIELFK